MMKENLFLVYALILRTFQEKYLSVMIVKDNLKRGERGTGKGDGVEIRRFFFHLFVVMKSQDGKGGRG